MSNFYISLSIKPEPLKLLSNNIFTKSKKNIYQNRYNLSSLAHLTLAYLCNLTSGDKESVKKIISAIIRNRKLRDHYYKRVKVLPKSKNNQLYIKTVSDWFLKEGTKVFTTKKGIKYAEIKKTNNNGDKVKFLVVILSSEYCKCFKHLFLKSMKSNNLQHTLGKYSNFGEGGIHLTIGKIYYPSYRNYEDIIFCGKNGEDISDVIDSYFPSKIDVHRVQYFKDGKIVLF